MSNPEAQIPGTLRWRVAGLARSPAKTTALVLLVPVTSLLGLLWTHQPIFLVLGPAFLAPVLSRYFLAPSYALTPESARASWGTMQTEIPWERVRRATEDGDALRLSPIPGKDLRSAFRGVELTLPHDPQLRTQILARVRAAIPPEAVYDGAVDDGEDAGD